MTQDEPHRGAPDSAQPPAGAEGQRQPGNPPLPSYGTQGSTSAGGQEGYGTQPGYGPPPGYGGQPA
jgi:hypothetical protein